MAETVNRPSDTGHDTDTLDDRSREHASRGATAATHRRGDRPGRAEHARSSRAAPTAPRAPSVLCLSSVTMRLDCSRSSATSTRSAERASSTRMSETARPARPMAHSTIAATSTISAVVTGALLRRLSVGQIRTVPAPLGQSVGQVRLSSAADRVIVG